MYRVEYINEFGFYIHSEWSDDIKFLKGYYHYCVSKKCTNVRIITKLDVTEHVLSKGDDE